MVHFTHWMLGLKIPPITFLVNALSFWFWMLCGSHVHQFSVPTISLKNKILYIFLYIINILYKNKLTNMTAYNT